VGCGLRVLRRGPGVTIGHAAGMQEAAYILTVEPERACIWPELRFDLVGGTGFEPVTSFGSGNAICRS
jgi:hypothetical protein